MIEKFFYCKMHALLGYGCCFMSMYFAGADQGGLTVEGVLAELIEIPCLGYEEQAAKRIADEFSGYCDEVQTDSFFNVYGIKKGPVSRESAVVPKSCWLRIWTKLP